MTHLSPRAIEAGADALRHLEQGGKRLNEWASLPNATKKKWTAKVQAVLTTLEAEGMVVVPREPTEAMLSAGDSMMPQIEPGQDITTGYDALKEAWPAMLQAAQGGDDAGQ